MNNGYQPKMTSRHFWYNKYTCHGYYTLLWTGNQSLGSIRV